MSENGHILLGVYSIIVFGTVDFHVPHVKFDADTRISSTELAVVLHLFINSYIYPEM